VLSCILKADEHLIVQLILLLILCSVRKMCI
jgi:hypothetical protein